VTEVPDKNGKVDLDLLLAPQIWDPHRCTVAQALDLLDDSDARAKVAAACDNQMVPARNIVQAFTHLVGRSPTSISIRRHQGRAVNSNPCRCP